MLGFSMNVISNIVTTITDEWEVAVQDLGSLSNAAVSEDVTVDTGSRPRIRVKATFSRRAQAETIGSFA